MAKRQVKITPKAQALLDDPMPDDPPQKKKRKGPAPVKQTKSKAVSKNVTDSPKEDGAKDELDEDLVVEDLPPVDIEYVNLVFLLHIIRDLICA